MKQAILNKDNFDVKFADGAFDTTGELNPGWAEPTYDEFFSCNQLHYSPSHYDLW